MTVEILFDTNAAIAWIERQVPLFAAIDPKADLIITTISIGELEYGAARSARPSANRARMYKSLSPFRRITIDDDTPHLYGQLLQSLKRKGRPIPTNDVWIAALALQHKLPLLTRDRHFQEVEGVDVRGW